MLHKAAVAWVVGVAMALVAGGASAAEPWSALISPDNSFDFSFLHEQKPVMHLGLVGWGPNWGWAGISAKDKATGDELTASGALVVNKSSGQILKITSGVAKAGPNAVAWRYELSADTDVPLTMLVCNLSINKSYEAGKVELTLEDGKTQQLAIPIQRRAVEGKLARATFKMKGLSDVVVTLDPPVALALDGNSFRIMLASEKFEKGTRQVKVTVTTPQPMDLLMKPQDIEKLTKTVIGPDWYELKGTTATDPSVIGMEDWLEKPAGKRGFVVTKDDKFVFEDGTPVKFWGTNLSYGASAPKKEEAEFTAARFAKYGVNAVRMHKFTGAGWEGIGDPKDATKMTAAGLDRLDYFAQQLRTRGVYYGWSHTFGFKVKPGNKDKLVAYDEIMAADKGGSTYALINVAEDVQDLMIQMVVDLLKHKNPHTGLTYAQDPALCYIELQNEDDIFFFTTESALKKHPTYRKLLTERFADFLKARYGSQEALAKAWGSALKPDETLEAKNIALQGNPWFMGDDHLPKQKDGARRRLLDNAAFFHETQNKFYGRFVKAIRDTGYKGALCGSPWQAPSGLPHYYNLKSDNLVGYIDRHNYAGGGLFYSMLREPGSGYFSSGLQQVADRPFGLSEWIHVYPSLYSAEGPAIVAAYGMGLQGWDASYEFQSTSAKQAFAPIAGKFPWGVWEADVPTQIGQYPALSRMILRGDVKEGAVISTRNVSPSELAEGTLPFSDKVVQQGDVKSFGGSVPPAALAAGRVVVQFTEQPKPSTFPDMSKYERDNVITASTGQLQWNHGDKPYFTVNTPGTRAVVGFAAGQSFDLDGVKIAPASDYASIFLTAIEKDATLANAKTALVTAVARNCNSGFTYFATSLKVLENGKGPILMEPVKATITIPGRKIRAVNVLDHDGRRTDRKLTVTGPSFTIDGAADKAFYYEVVFE